MTDEIRMNEMIDLNNVKYLLSLNNAELGQYIDPYNKYGEKRTKEDIQHYLSGIKKYLRVVIDYIIQGRGLFYSNWRVIIVIL